MPYVKSLQFIFQHAYAHAHVYVKSLQFIFQHAYAHAHVCRCYPKWVYICMSIPPRGCSPTCPNHTSILMSGVQCTYNRGRAPHSERATRKCLYVALSSFLWSDCKSNTASHEDGQDEEERLINRVANSYCRFAYVKRYHVSNQ